MRKRKLIQAAALMIIMTAVLNGCKPTPDKVIIGQKGNLDKVVQDNQTKATEGKVKDVVKAPEKTDFELSTANKKVDIKVNAGVLIPDVSCVSIVKVIRNDFEDKDIEPIIRAFFGDADIYPERTYENMSKDELLEEIARIQKSIDEADADIKEAIDKKSKSYIEMLQSLVSTAPDHVELKPIAEFKFTKDDTYGNDTLLASGKIGDSTGHFIIQKGDAYCSCSLNVDLKEGQGTGFYTRGEIESEDGKDAANMDNTCKYSEKEGEALCVNAIMKMGMDKEYSLYSIEPVATALPSKGGNSYNGYIIKFSRNVGGILETNDIYNGTLSEEEITDYPYAYESMNFIVLDSGIVSFSWDSPMKQGDTMAENVKLLDYSKIEDIFKQQVLVQFADVTDAETINVSEIRFGLMRVKDKNNKKEFTMVPVWDFITDLYGGASIMTVNAIDGSILNRSYGY